MAMKGFFECPRCNGTDIYVAKRQRVVGTSVNASDS
jgi:anaerobic ribonucleoside-triphosphate reductase